MHVDVTGTLWADAVAPPLAALFRFQAAMSALYYAMLYFTTLYYNILYYTILYYTILYYTIQYCCYGQCSKVKSRKMGPVLGRVEVSMSMLK